MTESELAVKNLLVDAAVIIIDGDAYCMLYCDEETFTAELEDEFCDPEEFSYGDVDLKRDMIYKLTLVNPL